MQRIREVKTVDLYLVESTPPKVAVTAAGVVPTTGWTGPELAPWISLTPPADGIQDFDFYAQEPTGITLRVDTPIAAGLIIDRDPDNYWGRGQPLVGVRIHSKGDSIEAKFDGKKIVDAHQVTLSARGGNEVPWPFPGSPRMFGGEEPFPSVAGAQNGASLGELLGKTLRLYRTGDLLTGDFLTDRANIELDPATSRIVDIRFG